MSSSKQTLISILASVFIVKCYANDINIDGFLDEAAWHSAVEINQSFAVIPQTLNPNNDKFSYKLITTKSGLYIGLKAPIQSPLVLRTQENDTEFSNEHFQIMLDMKNSGQESYVFGVNHEGYYLDGEIDQDRELDLDWSAEWDYAVNTKDEEWSAEVYIPWSAMSFAIKTENQFGLYISYFDEESNSTFASSPTNYLMNNFYRQFSKYTAVISHNNQFNIFPYVSFNRNIIDSSESSYLGAEIFWQPSNGHTLSATINPDFGQVESDELVVNFSAIETFFSEKRPFFNNNQSLFEVTGPESLTIVHSPRIGGESFYDEDYVSDLNSAVKYTMNQASFDFGLLMAQESSIAGSAGRGFNAIRGKYIFDENSIGISINHVKTPSIDRKATVVSTDLEYAFSPLVQLSFGVIKSLIDENGEKINDMGWWVKGRSEIFDNQIHEFSLFAYGENLQLNDIGYVQRVNRKQFEYEYQYQIPSFDSELIRDVIFLFETELKTNFAGEKLPQKVGAGVELVSGEEFEYQLSFEAITSGVDDLVTRGNNSVALPSALIVEFELSSAEYDWGQYEFEVIAGSEGWRGLFYDFEVSIEQQLTEDLLLGLSISQYNSDSWIDWDEENVIEEFNFTEQELAINVDYQIDDNQELRIKFEAVIGKGDNLGVYSIHSNGSAGFIEVGEDFSFSENAFQLRYKYSLSKLTAFYLSYGFGGDYEDELAKFGKRNLYKRAIEAKNSHNIFAKIRLHF